MKRYARDPLTGPEILALAEQAMTDLDARAVLHDALLEAYPRVYGNLVKRSEMSPAAMERRWKRTSWIGSAFRGRRVIAFCPHRFEEALEFMRDYQKKYPRATAAKLRALWNYWVRLSFAINTAWSGEKKPRLFSSRCVITYVSRQQGKGQPLYTERRARRQP